MVRDLIFAFKIFRVEVRLQASKYWIFKPTNGRRGGVYDRREEQMPRVYMEGRKTDRGGWMTHDFEDSPGLGFMKR
ncbi:hypothetical protein Y032_0001g16 [Ancylostoma ceylanicum]|uniref:Uncharacterized protein n=1 Tax=Ancylostoma ceylanicum TaxID=53326 RepID=A0A016W4I2_9BILA|nr:hypothetical protein Y032_0001g16 [Ancylostoma ceylanicum]